MVHYARDCTCTCTCTGRTTVYMHMFVLYVWYIPHVHMQGAYHCVDEGEGGCDLLQEVEHPVLHEPEQAWGRGGADTHLH